MSFKIFQPKKLLFVLFLLIPFGIFAQQPTGFVINDPGDYDVSLLTRALESAKLDAYRQVSVRRELTFENGASVYLFSGKEMEEAGLPVNTSLCIADDADLPTDRVFLLHPAGFLMESVSSPNPKTGN